MLTYLFIMPSRRGSRGVADGAGSISGELFKRRGGWGKHLPQSWHKRFFTISDGIMSYYEDAHANIVRGQLDLKEEGLCVEFGVVFEYAPTQYGFQISTASFPEKWKMCADSLEEYQRWVIYIQNFLNGNVKSHSPSISTVPIISTPAVANATKDSASISPESVPAAIIAPTIAVSVAHSNVSVSPIQKGDNLSANFAGGKNKPDHSVVRVGTSTTPRNNSRSPLYRAMAMIFLLLVCVSVGITTLEASMEEFKKTTWIRSISVSNNTVLFYSRYYKSLFSSSSVTVKK